MNHLVLAVTLVLMLAGAGTAWHFWQKHRHQARRASRLQDHAGRLTQQLRAAEQCLGYLASTVLPAVGTAAQTGRDHSVDLVVPSQLMNTPLADRLGNLTGQLVATVAQVRTSAETEAGRHIAQVQTAASREVTQAREESQEVTRAAVRSFASTVVGMASKVSREVSQGVRRHQGDEAYATLVGIDHPAQQMLLAAQGYVVLAGGKLSRRWPTTSLTEVVRAAMGRIEGFERVKHQELDLAVDSRAVEAVVHTLAVLLDNALRYSPPAASVYVALLEGHHGTSVIVDDAGLRMSDELLLWARQVLSGERRDDVTQLGAHPQTGLRVAALLAQNYGFRVDIEAPNTYQGTRAVLFLPKNLLANAAPRPAPAVAAAAQGPERETVPETTAATTASGLAVRTRPSCIRPTTTVAVPSAPAEPGRPGVAAAWAAGTRSARQHPEPTGRNEGR